MKTEEFIKYYENAKPVELDPTLTETLKLLDDGEDRPETEDTLTRAQAAEDIALFFDLLRVCYAGYPYYEDKVDFTGIRDGLTASIPDEGVSAAWIRDGLYRQLKPYIVDSHFHFRDGGRFARPVNAYFTGLTVEADGGGFRVVRSESEQIGAGRVFPAESLAPHLFETLPAPDGTKRYLVGALSAEKPDSLEIAGTSLPLHRCRTDSFVPHHGAWSEWTADNGIRISVDTSFDGGAVAATNQSLGKGDNAHYERGLNHRNDPVLIWSLLGNHGGDSRYPEAFIRGLNGYACWESEGAVLKAVPSSDGTKYLTQIQTFASERLDLSRSEYAGRLFVLQNKAVASSGEAAVKYAKSVKNAVFVGSATSGCGQFGDNRRYQLPNSGVTFFMGYKVFNMDGFEEGKGLLPDYWIDSADPWEELAGWIRSME